MALARWHAALPTYGPRAVGGSDNAIDPQVARVLFCLHEHVLVALHGFIKKTQKAPDEGLALARKRQKELEK